MTAETLQDALETAPQPGGRTARKWFRLGWLCAVEVNKDLEASARAESDALRAALEEGRRRVADLRDCNKDDDCHVMAKGAALVIEDIEYALAPSPAEGESR